MTIKMTIKITIPDNRSAEFVSLLQNFLATPDETVQQPATTPESAKKAVTPAPEKTTARAANDEQAPEITTTLEEVRAAVVAKTRAGHKEAVIAILTEMGAATVTALKPTQYTEFLLRVNAL